MSIANAINGGDAGGRFMISKSSTDQASSELCTTAGQIADSASEQIQKMMGILGVGWGDSGAEEALCNYQLSQKETGHYCDGLTGEAKAYSDSGHDAMDTLMSVCNMLRRS